MASSFDTEQVSQGDRVYGEVMALYAAIKDTPGVIKVRRAVMRQGEVQAEPIDFIIDVELKAKRSTQDDPFAKAEWGRVLAYPEEYMSLVSYVRASLGKEFDRSRLGVDGDYRKLYFRVKNYSQHFKEDTSAIFE